MKLRIRNTDIALVLGAGLLCLAVSVAGWVLVGEVALVLPPILSAMLVLVVLLEMYRRRLSERDLLILYQQIESLCSLLVTLKPSLPLPEMRGWAASPDLLKKITEVILIESPRLVVEASSGASTVVIAYCLKRLGKGKVISLEHDAKFAAITQSNLAFHGLEDVATVLHAPLTEIVI